MLKMDEEFDFKLPRVPVEEFKHVQLNISNIFVKPNVGVAEVELADLEHEQFLADVWVGVVLTLMVLSCVCFMCTCLIYHKFQQWKSRVIEARNAADLESGTGESELPSYTIASGLPTYEEALEQLKKVKELSGYGAKTVETMENQTARTPPTTTSNTLSVMNLFQLYKNSDSASVADKNTVKGDMGIGAS